ncbi:MAG TPA: potassium-transporting ATPase subunit C [Chthoniobacter sp.]|jgi:K+-transporting ATPase ATPase C chain
MKTFLIEIKNTIVATIVFGIICCGIYPLAVYGVGQLLFNHQANGSLIVQDGKIVGSELLGQPFASDKYFIPRTSAAGTGYDASNSSGSNLSPTSKKLINGTTKSIAVADKDGKITQAPDVVDYDGIKIRIIGFCDQNGIPYQLVQDDKVVEPKTFKTERGDWDQVKLITAFNDDNKPLTVKPSVLIPGDAVTSSASGLDPHISVKNAMLQLPRVAKTRSLSEDKVKEMVAQNTDGPGLGIFGDAGVNVLKLNLALDKLAPVAPAPTAPPAAVATPDAPAAPAAPAAPEAAK